MVIRKRIPLLLIYVKQEAEVCVETNEPHPERNLFPTPTNVDDVAFAVDQDVPVVSILDLEDVAHHRIGRHGLDEVQASLLELDRVLSAVLGDEEVKKVVDLRSAHLVTRGGVRHDVNDATLCLRSAA